MFVCNKLACNEFLFDIKLHILQGNSTYFEGYSEASNRKSVQLYSKVNKKNKCEKILTPAKTDKEELTNITVNEAKDLGEDESNWNELTKRNFTLEEILSLETNNQVKLFL